MRYKLKTTLELELCFYHSAGGYILIKIKKKLKTTLDRYYGGP